MTPQQKYYINHKEKYKQISKDWKSANPEKVNEYALEHYYRYHEEHKEQAHESNREYYRKNADKIKESSKKYYDKNYNLGVMASRTGCRGCPVLCIETDEIFDSAAEASRHINRSRNGVIAAIHLNRKCAGYTWRYLTQKEINNFNGDL